MPSVSIASLGSVRLLASFVLLGAAFVLPARAESFQTLHNFTGGADGGNPTAGVVADSAGNLYGTTQLGGGRSNDLPSGAGVVFRYSAAGQYTVLHTFTNGTDGAFPDYGVRLIRGRLYGGTKSSLQGIASVLYSMAPDGSDFRVLHNLTQADGQEIVNLLPGAGGSIIGIAQSGGADGEGTLFQLAGNGKFTVLHNFGEGGGERPNALVESPGGAIYGSSAAGGLRNAGALFGYDQHSHQFATLYSFPHKQTQGQRPVLGAVSADGRTLYGVSQSDIRRASGILFAYNVGAATLTELAPLVANYQYDEPLSAPTLNSQGVLVGQMISAAIYHYAAGQLSITYLYHKPRSPAQFLIPAHRPTTLVNTSEWGGNLDWGYLYLMTK